MAKDMVHIQNLIYEIRGHKVMLDRDLAELYGVELRTLNQAVKRKIERFPSDFMFQLKQDEWEILRSQFVIANTNLSKLRFLPYVFTEQGVAMLSGILNSDIAVAVNIQIMRAFVQLRHYTLSLPETNAQIAELLKLLLLYIEKNDKRVNEIIIALNNLIAQPPKAKTIGFNVNEKAPVYLTSKGNKVKGKREKRKKQERG